MLSVVLIMSTVMISCSRNGREPKGTASATDDTVADSSETAASPAYARYAEADAKYINSDTIAYFCNTNEALLAAGTRVTGLVLEIPGLDGNSCLGGSMNMQPYHNDFTRHCAEQGIIVAYTFPGPWSYMNAGAVRIVDLLVDAFMEKYGFEDEDDFSLVVMGGSMGGAGALIYAIDSRHTVDACVSHCPASDRIRRFQQNATRREMMSAVNAYDMPLEEGLKRISPQRRVAEMPDIPYIVAADELDEVCPVGEIEAMVDEMRENGLTVHYMFLEGQTHGGISAEDRDVVNEFVLKYGKLRS